MNRHKTAIKPRRSYRRTALVAAIGLVALLASCQAIRIAPEGKAMLKWNELPALPDTIGFAGPFAGMSHGALLVAGGANFPQKMPWEGGTKVWHDRGFVMEAGAAAWAQSFALPRPLAYGVSLTTPDGLLCIGGGDATRHSADVFLLQWQHGKVTTKAMPALPGPCAFASGALLENTVYIAGGIERPDSTSALSNLWTLDLKHVEAGWRRLPPCPGPARMLAVAGAQDGAFFLFSGASLSPGDDGKPKRTLLRDAWRYSPGAGWKRLADLPRPAVAAPSPAATASPALLLIAGGDDGTHMGQDLRQRHPGFAADVLAYHAASDTWVARDTIPAPAALVTTPLVPTADGFIIPGGEIRPGIRSTRVYRAALSR